jgi:hypothetical protein
LNIIYCEKCGKRISAEELNEGAVETAENQFLCAGCNAPAPAVQRPKSGQAVNQVLTQSPAPSARRTTSTHIPKHSSPQAARKDTKDSSKGAGKEPLSLPVIAGIGVGGLSLIVGLVLLFGGRKKEIKEPGGETARTAATVKDEGSKAPVLKSASPPVPDPKQIIEMKPPPQQTPQLQLPVADSAPPVKAQDDRAKQFEKEMEEFRNQRAKRVLDEHIAWFKQNPTDGWNYKIRLQEFVGSYGTAPVAAEARKLIDELKDVKPPPDVLESAAPESKNYQLVYDLNLARLGQSITYTVDNCASIKQAFDRIAYFLELQKKSGETEYIYISMDAFTDDPKKIGIPTVESGARFQQKVTNMNVIVNANGITGGNALDSGNIEFWPNNYGPNNSANIPNAAQDKFDFGDGMGAPDQGYGSMQIHNHAARQTLFAINHWGVGESADIGIGNSPAGNPDWTFVGNGGSYRTKRLRILVHLK